MIRRLLLLLPLAAAAAACTPRQTQHPAEAASAVGAEPRPARTAPAATPGAPGPGVVDAATALSLAAAGARLVDVRTPQEFADGRVAGAVNVPFDEVMRRLAEVGPSDAPIVLYCRSGRRSAIAAEALRERGYRRVYDAQRYDALAGAAQGG